MVLEAQRGSNVQVVEQDEEVGENANGIGEGEGERELNKGNTERQTFEGVKFYATDVEEDVTAPRGGGGGGGIVYSHKLREGVNRESYGLQVAKLANLPAETLEVARQTLEALQAKAS